MVNAQSSLRSLVFVALFAAFIAVLGLIPKIDLPLGVPITLQMLGVMLAGCLLGARRAAQTLLLFLAAVAIGMPLLAGGRGGLAAFMAPTAGYLVGWFFGAVTSGWIMSLLPSGSPRRAALSAFLAAFFGCTLSVHLCGVVGLVYIAGFTWAQAFWGTLLFVPTDLIKCAICALIVHSVARGLPDWRFNGQTI